MRINSINILNLNNKVNDVKSKNNFTTRLNNLADSISFGASVLPYNEVSELKKEAYLLEVEAHNNLKTGYDLKEESKKIFTRAKKQYLNALSYVQAYYQTGQSRIDFESGAYVQFAKEPTSSAQGLTVDVYNEYGALIKTIISEYSLPTKIINHLDGKANIYDFSTDTIVVSKGVSLGGDSFGECDSIHSFRNGKISTINLKGQILSEPNTFDECYTFFNDKLISYSTDNRIYSGKSYYYGERYAYVNDRLLTYYEEFDGQKDGSMDWKCSYHFANSKLMAKVLNAKQETGKPIVSPRKVIYKDTQSDNYLSSSTAKILVSDFGGLTVIEKK